MASARTRFREGECDGAEANCDWRHAETRPPLAGVAVSRIAGASGCGRFVPRWSSALRQINGEGDVEQPGTTRMAPVATSSVGMCVATPFAPPGSALRLAGIDQRVHLKCRGDDVGPRVEVGVQGPRWMRRRTGLRRRGQLWRGLNAPRPHRSGAGPKSSTLWAGGGYAGRAFGAGFADHQKKHAVSSSRV